MPLPDKGCAPTPTRVAPPRRSNSFLGAIIADDDSLCGGDLKFKGKCPIRAIVSNYSTHLLNLPGNPCQMPVWTDWVINGGPGKADPYPDPANPPLFGRKWFRRFGGHMICTKTVRRFNIWGPDQGQMVLAPPSNARNAVAWPLNWLGFGIINDKTGVATCWWVGRPPHVPRCWLRCPPPMASQAPSLG